ncbi:DUF4012 domain-containing protein [Candidatus Roizmanbacteria bacterium]|nr:DUF4012 domain-containing protein [Candidatus Roizmanbacteria bacterium]
MKLKVETLEDKQKSLIVYRKLGHLIELLKSKLAKKNVEVYLSPLLPKKIDVFDYCFLIDEKRAAEKAIEYPKKNIVAIFINQEKAAKKLVHRRLKNLKIINIAGNFFSEMDVDRILWFSFSQTKEQYLSIYALTKSKPFKNKFRPSLDLKKMVSKKVIVPLILVLLFLYHFAFLVPLSFSGYLSYQVYSALKKEDWEKSGNYLRWLNNSNKITKEIYSLSRPTFSLFSAAILPDNLIEINEKAYLVFNELTVTNQNVKEIAKLIANKSKNQQEKQEIAFRVKVLQDNLKQMEENLSTIVSKIPNQLPVAKQAGQKISEITQNLSLANKLIPYLDNILAKDTEKKYLLIFANNMELRPGGGFIGSFGVLTVKDYTFQEIKIYDVYDADGQLVAHIEPPAPIKKYLNMPHWFLRDSNFSPDFYENYEQAKFFLDKEMNMRGFAGSFLMTTTAVQNILESFGNIYLPDYNETINQKNFYLKTQYYAENNFLPGSIQKKSFLGSLSRQVILNWENASPKKMALGLKKSLDEKQMVFYAEDPDLQEAIDSLFWSGKISQPKCIQEMDNCVVDYLYPVDANLGANKANFFINRLIDIKIKIDENGEIIHSLTVNFKNDSPNDVFPGGTYHNYFQTYLPKDALLGDITQDGTAVDQSEITVEEKNSLFKTVGFMVRIRPKTSSIVKIDYKLGNAFKKGKGLYQLIIQKQIGSANNDLVLRLDVAKNVYILNQNFSPLVKDNQIVYNTNLSADKIFFVEIIKDADK